MAIGGEKMKQFLFTLKNNFIKIKNSFIAWLDTGNKTTVFFLAPYILMFTIFIVIPVGLAILLSITYFNGIQAPEFTGLSNYIYLLTQDEVFMKTIIPNTLLFAVIVGPGGYIF